MPEGFKIASAWVEVSPDDTGFKEKLQAQLDEAVAGVHADATVGLDTSELDAQAADARRTIADLDGEEARATLGLDKDDFDAKLDEARGDLDEMDAKESRPKLGLDDSEFQRKLAQDKAEADSAGGGGEGGSLIGAITMGVSTLLPGIGGAAAGMGLLAGTGALALGGISKALSAHSQATQTVGQTSATLAQTAFTNTVAIQQAQQSVGDAYRQAAEDATASAQQIQSAQMSLAETTRNAAAAQIQAEQAVGQAENQLKDAQFNETEAQVNLTNARIQARLQLQQLNDAQKDSVIATKSARLALEQAQYQQTLTDQNAMSTNLDKQQAALAVTQAQRQLIEAQQNQTNSAQAAHRADQQGVDGSQEVVEAKHAVVDAIEAVKQAEQQEADAQRALTNTELNNADQIKAAQLAVLQAEQQAANTQQRDAEAVATAQRNLSDTYKEQQLAAAAAKSTSNQAANQFAMDMARLSPAARTFVRDLLGMSGAWHHLEGIAQGAVLPGLTIFLNGIKDNIPVIDRGVREMGDAMSSSFSGFGKLMQGSAFKDGLGGLLRNGVQFAKIVLPAFAQFLQELGEIGGKQGAVTGLSNLLAGIAHGLTGIARGVAPYTTQINQFLSAVGLILAAIGPPLGRMVGLIAQTLGPLTRYLDAHPNGTVVKIIGDIVAGLLALKGLQKILPSFITEPLGKLGSKLGGKITDPLKEAAAKIPGILGKGWELAGQGAMRVFGAGGVASQAFGKLEGYAGTAAGTVARWGGQFAGQLGTMAGSVASFAAQTASQLATAAGATAAWIAEHAVAAGEFLAQNIAMAASATVAFIAENAATLGIGAAIALLVTGIIYLATHWHQVWTAVKDVAEDAWRFLTHGWGQFLVPGITLIRLAIQYLSDHWSTIWGDIKDVTNAVWQDGIDPVFQGIRAGISFLIDDVIEPYFRIWLDQFDLIKDGALALWHDVLDPVWHGIEAGARDFVSGFETVWHRLESVFATPVNLLISTVYDKGIARLWNDVVEHIGLGSLKLPIIAPLTLSKGGKLGGYGGGDRNPALLESGETVVSKEDSRKPFMQAAFTAAGVPGYKKGGLIGDIGAVFGGLGHDLSFLAGLATDPVKAVENLLDKVVHTSASGDLGKVMTGIPKALIGDLGKAVGLAGSSSGGGIGSTGGLGGSAKGDALVKYAESFIGRVPYVWGGTTTEGWDCSGYVDYVLRHFGFQPPRTSEEQFSWVKRTATPIVGGLAFFSGADGTASSPGHVGIITGANQMVDAYGTGFGTRLNSLYGSSGVVSGFGVPPGGGLKFDQGGVWPSGMPGINTTGKPEAVLDPQQTQLLIAALQRLAEGQNTAAGVGPQVNLNYFGPQAPTPEMQAAQRRDLALLLGEWLMTVNAQAGEPVTLELEFFSSATGGLADPDSVQLVITYGGEIGFVPNYAGPFSYSGASSPTPGQIYRTALGEYAFEWEVPTDAPGGAYVANWPCTFGDDDPLAVENIWVSGGFAPPVPVGDIGFWTGDIDYVPPPGNLAQLQTLSIPLGQVDEFGVAWIINKLEGWDSPDVQGGGVIAKSGDHGGWAAPQFYAPRTLTLTVTALAPTQALRDDARARLQAAIPINDLAIFTYNEPTPKQVAVRRSGKVAETYTDLMAAQFSAVLVCPDPRKYAAQGSSVGPVNATPSTGIGWTSPWSGPWAAPPQPPSGSIAVLNGGTFETRPVITITGPLSGPSLTNITTGQTVSWSQLDLGAGDVLVADFSLAQATLNGVYRPADVSSSWWVLPPGTTCTVQVGGEAGAGASLSVAWSDAYI